MKGDFNKNATHNMKKVSLKIVCIKEGVAIIE